MRLAAMKPCMPKEHEGDEGFRHIRLERASNLRDFGGYPSRHGGNVRRQLLYRSGAMPHFADAEWKWATERAIRTVVDLRSQSERVLAPTRWKGPSNVTFIEAQYDAALIFGDWTTQTVGPTAINAIHRSLYTTLADILAPSICELMKALLNEAAPVIIHCSAGQDRTGLAVALVLDLLGVHRQIITEDYLLSTAARRPANEFDGRVLAQQEDINLVARFYARMLAHGGNETMRARPLVGDDGRPLLDVSFAAIEQKWGSAAAYCFALGIGDAEIKRLRELYLK
jgi:protein-tyrosine phosphatase